MKRASMKNIKEINEYIDFYIKDIQEDVCETNQPYLIKRIKATVTELKNLKSLVKFRPEVFSIENIQKICDSIKSRNFSSYAEQNFGKNMSKYALNYTSERSL